MRFNEQQQIIIGGAEPGGKQILVGNALSGTGKSTVLKGMAGGPLRRERIGYFVYNRRNAVDARAEFPSNVATKTAHSFAFGARHPDDRSRTMMQVYTRHLAKGSLYGPLRDKADQDPLFARHVMAVADALSLPRGQALMAIQGMLRHYCQSASERVGRQHIPSALNAHLKRQGIGLGDCAPLIDATTYVFARMRDPSAEWPVDHGLYLKLYSLEPGRIAVDTIMFDEGQDANPPMLAILKEQVQHGTRLVLVGDTYQHIYDFTGAIDAMAHMRQAYPSISEVFPLTVSYRFGPQVAEAGNRFLRLLESPYFLEGRGPEGQHIDAGEIQSDDERWTTLYRTNMALLTDAVEHIEADRRVHVVGGVGDAVKLMEGMARLYQGEFARHPELGFFADWKELAEYADSDEGGSIRPMVRLVEREGGYVAPLVAALERTEKRAERADQVLSTAHKSKGGQWDQVRLSSDFHRAWEPDMTAEGEQYTLPDGAELALQYVAVTRAQKALHTNGLISVMERALSEMVLPENTGDRDRMPSLAASVG